MTSEQRRLMALTKQEIDGILHELRRAKHSTKNRLGHINSARSKAYRAFYNIEAISAWRKP